MVFGISDSKALRKNIQKIQTDYDIILIDGTPSLSKLVSTIILLGDIVLIPIRPSGLDLWATEKFIEKYEQAKTLKEDVNAYFVLNQYDGNININRETKDVLEELEIKTLKTTVKSRIAYVEAVVQGIGVYEYRDRKAKEEMTALTKEILDIITK